MHADALPVGQQLPDFTLPTDRGHTFRSAEKLGQRLVLFFYPQAETEGCTIETLEFDALRPRFLAEGIAIAGVSPDSVETLARFRRHHDLTLDLVADPDRTLIGALGLWREKTTFGRTYIGLVRTTLLIEPDGTIGRLWTVTRIKGHAAAVLATLSP